MKTFFCHTPCTLSCHLSVHTSSSSKFFSVLTQDKSDSSLPNNDSKGLKDPPPKKKKKKIIFRKTQSGKEKTIRPCFRGEKKTLLYITVYTHWTRLRRKTTPGAEEHGSTFDQSMTQSLLPADLQSLLLTYTSSLVSQRNTDTLNRDRPKKSIQNQVNYPSVLQLTTYILDCTTMVTTLHQ